MRVLNAISSIRNLGFLWVGFFVEDWLAFGDGRYWSYIEAKDLNGVKEDVTKDFVRYLSNLEVGLTQREFADRTSVTVNSTFLKIRQSSQYKDPFEVISNNFSDAETFRISLGSKQGYQLVKNLDFGIISFQETTDLNLQADKNIYFAPMDLVKIENLRPTVLGLIVFILTISLIAIYFFTKKRYISQL